ncbi:MAG: hypothetical protein ACOC11_01335, partial [Prolixibacteraceae bacterium]
TPPERDLLLFTDGRLSGWLRLYFRCVGLVELFCRTSFFGSLRLLTEGVPALLFEGLSLR